MASVVFILLDGFRHDYVSEESTPVLYRVASRANAVVARTREPFGFQSRPAFLAGLYPEESGVCTLFKYSPQTSPFGKVGPLARLGKVPRLGARLRKRIEARTARLEGDIYRYLHTTAGVPLSLLPHFDYSEKELPWNASFATPTIFDLIRERGGDFLYMGWPVYSSPLEDDRVVEHLRESLNSKHRFIFAQLVLPDAVGHEHGPDSAQLRKALRETDTRFGHILSILEKSLTDFVLFVYGDHGMVRVDKHLDLWRELKSAGPRPWKDYLVFLDSTAARFWFRDDRVREQLVNRLREVEGGRVLEDEDLERHHIRFKDRSYGDITFLAAPGNLIHPSFFSAGLAPKGMHGYDPDIRANQGIFIMVPGLSGRRSMPEIVDHVDLYATAVRLLGHDLPPLAHGRDLLKG